jgi:hypothetical protein
MNVDLVRELLNRAALASRADAARKAAEARREGKLQEISAWRARLRKIDRRIAQYGLDRYGASQGPILG